MILSFFISMLTDRKLNARVALCERVPGARVCVFSV